MRPGQHLHRVAQLLEQDPVPPSASIDGDESLFDPCEVTAQDREFGSKLGQGPPSVVSARSLVTSLQPRREPAPHLGRPAAQLGQFPTDDYSRVAVNGQIWL